MKLFRLAGSVLGLSLALTLATTTFSPSASAQAISSNGGAIQGTITDPTGAAVPGATVVISNPDTGYTHTLTTDGVGFYSLGPLIPGPYVITVTAGTFAKLKVTTVVRTGTATSGNEKLSLGGATETVEVTAGAIQVNTDQISVAGVVTQEQIDNLPVNGRNILDVAQLQPGVILEGGQSFDPTKAGYSAISVGGVGGRTTRILLDGQDITDETVGTTLFNVPTGAIGDFQLNRSTQDVSGEVTSTGQVLMSTRSGTNAFHGQLFYIFQDARAGFAQVAGTTAPFQRNQFGGGVGGPIIKDKLFFFAESERLKQDEQDQALASNLFSDPTQIAGDPYLTTPILTKYPLVPAPFRDTFTTGRLDYNAPHGIHLFARAVYSNNDDVSNFGDLYSIYSNQDNVPALVGGADFTTGSFTHSFRGGYEKFHNSLADATARFATSLYNPIPSYTLQGEGLYAGINDLAPQGTFQSDKQLRYDGTWTKGAHTVKFGGEVNRILGGGFAAFYGSANLVQFGPGQQLANCANNTALGPCPGDPVNGYSQALVVTGNGNGLFSEKPGFGLPGGGVFSWRVAYYVADTWKISSAFTATAGLRWDVDTDRANQDLPTPSCASIDTGLQFPGCTGNTPLFSQYGSTTGSAPYGYKTHQPYGNFGPQVGFVYSPGAHKFSIRAGTGIYYENDIFNNTGNARPSLIPGTTKGAFFNYGVPCGNYFPGSSLSNPTGAGQSLNQLCNTDSLAQAAAGFADIRNQYQSQTKGVSAPNPNYIGFGSGGDLYANGVYAGPYLTPYSIQYNGGVQDELAKGLVLSVDYLHNTTLKVPLTIDVNRVGAARTLNVAAAQAAIANTLAGCGALSINAALTPGGCPNGSGPNGTANVVDFAANGLDSGNNGQNFSGIPSNQTGAAFGGINRNVGQGKFILPTGKSAYDAMQIVLQQQKAHPLPGIVSSDVSIAYSLSRIITATGGGTQDQFFAGAGPWDYDNPDNYLGRSELDHTNEVTFGGSFAIKYGAKLGLVGHFFSAPPTSITLDNGTFAGFGEILRTDVTGDGTTGDLLPGTRPGAYEHSIRPSNLNKVINNYNATQAGNPTPAGQALISAGLFTLQQLQTIKAVKPLLATAPTTPLSNAALRVFDANVSYPIRLSRLREGLSIEPGVAFYNLFNMSNFAGPSGVVLTQDDAGGAVNTTQPGYLAGPNSQAVLNSQFRTERAAGTFDQGAPRSTQFQLKVIF
jgi:hypothetical protein